HSSYKVSHLSVPFLNPLSAPSHPNSFVFQSFWNLLLSYPFSSYKVYQLTFLFLDHLKVPSYPYSYGVSHPEVHFLNPLNAPLCPNSFVFQFFWNILLSHPYSSYKVYHLTFLFLDSLKVPSHHYSLHHLLSPS
ncbi:unnamed protein product, partial [Linum tenue]